jgi:hypothetical protein
MLEAKNKLNRPEESRVTATFRRTFASERERGLGGFRVP